MPQQGIREQRGETEGSATHARTPGHTLPAPAPTAPGGPGAEGPGPAALTAHGARGAPSAGAAALPHSHGRAGSHRPPRNPPGAPEDKRGPGSAA